MYSFEEIGRYHVQGRGTAITVKNPHLPELWDPSMLMSEGVVQIGEEEYVVKGIETFAIFRSEDHPYRHDFSILIQDIS
jgi:hypothetical protein